MAKRSTKKLGSNDSLLGAVIRRCMAGDEASQSQRSTLQRSDLVQACGLGSGGASYISKVMSGNEHLGPLRALKLLRLLKPQGDDLATFLKETGLDAFFAELEQLYRDAGYSSRLTARTNLLWAGQLGAVVARRAEVEITAVAYAIDGLAHRRASTAELADRLNDWKSAMAVGNFRQANIADQWFHTALLDMSRAGYAAVHSNEETKLYGVIVDRAKDAIENISLNYVELLHKDPFEEPLDEQEKRDYLRRSWVGRHSTEEEELMIFKTHENILDAINSQDKEVAAMRMSEHFDWLRYWRT